MGLGRMAAYHNVFFADPEGRSFNCFIPMPFKTGARIIVTLLNALQKRGGKRGIATLCIGGGEATAVAVELL